LEDRTGIRIFFKRFSLIMLTLAFLAACIPEGNENRDQGSKMEERKIPSVQVDSKSDTENANTGSTLVQSTEVSEQVSEQKHAVVYLGIMVHLEGWADGTNENAFREHAQLMRDYADLFETYGAKLTWESKELTDGCLRWGDDVLLEMQQRGHGIGLHADVGGNSNDQCSEMKDELVEMKSKLEQLGVTVRHVSGIASRCDWVGAAVDAGFSFTTGTVAYATVSLTPKLIPEQFRDCSNPAQCHQPYPTTLEERLHPWRANSGLDWIIHDPDGELVILPENGGLSSKYEQSVSEEAVQHGSEFTREDIDVFIDELETVVEIADPDQVNTYYVSWSLGSPLDKTLLEEWLQRIQPYVENGKVQWKTLPEMYDAYLQWEQDQ
jgi:hypothetical protein